MFGETTISQVEISKNPVEIELPFGFRNKFEDTQHQEKTQHERHYLGLPGRKWSDQCLGSG